MMELVTAIGKCHNSGSSVLREMVSHLPSASMCTCTSVSGHLWTYLCACCQNVSVERTLMLRLMLRIHTQSVDEEV